MSQSDSGSLPSPYHPAGGPVPTYRSHTGLHECPILTWTNQHLVSLLKDSPGEGTTKHCSHLWYVEDLIGLKLRQTLLQLLLGTVSARGRHSIEKFLEQVQILTSDTGYKEDRRKAKSKKKKKEVSLQLSIV